MKTKVWEMEDGLGVRERRMRRYEGKEEEVTDGLEVGSWDRGGWLQRRGKCERWKKVVGEEIKRMRRYGGNEKRGKEKGVERWKCEEEETEERR